MAEPPSSFGDTSFRPRRLWASLRRIFQLGWPYRYRLGTALALMLVGSAVVLIVPLGLRALVDAVFQEGNRALLDWLALALIVLFVIRAAASFGGRYLLGWTSERVVADLRKKVYRHLHRQSLQFFDDRRTGDLPSRLTNDVDAHQLASPAHGGAHHVRHRASALDRKQRANSSRAILGVVEGFLCGVVDREGLHPLREGGDGGAELPRDGGVWVLQEVAVEDQ